MIKIPKIIHVIWIGPNHFPYKKNLESYKKLNKGWKINFITNDKIPKIINKSVYRKLNSWAAKVDLLRLEVLYKHGGLYVDADSTCLKPLAPLLNDLTLFGMTGNHGNVANGTIGCTKNHPALKELVFGVNTRISNLSKLKINKKIGISIYNVVGTGYITRILRRYSDFYQIDKGCKKGNRKLIGTIKDVDIIQTGYILHKNDRTWRRTKRIKL